MPMMNQSAGMPSQQTMVANASTSGVNPWDMRVKVDADSPICRAMACHDMFRA